MAMALKHKLARRFLNSMSRADYVFSRRTPPHKTLIPGERCVVVIESSEAKLRFPHNKLWWRSNSLWKLKCLSLWRLLAFCRSVHRLIFIRVKRFSDSAVIANLWGFHRGFMQLRFACELFLVSTPINQNSTKHSSFSCANRAWLNNIIKRT